MPKIVDHEQRRTQIAEATWRVILDNGMEGATVRNIAKEAGLSLGALRHYFSTQNELLIYAMNLVKERATNRINKIVMSDLPPKEKVVSILMEIVPVNTETIAEMEVWLAFTFHSKNKVDIFDKEPEFIFDFIRNRSDYLNKHLGDLDETKLKAKQDWKTGRFAPVPQEHEFIPLPE